MNDTVYQFTVKDRAGSEVSLKDYAGKVLLIVNTATRCGFTPQYDGLEAMYERLKGRGFELLDFPCNQFGQQAPGTDEEIHGFCVLNYKTAFPQFAKVEVNGENAAPPTRPSAASRRTASSRRFSKRCLARPTPTMPRSRTSNGTSQSFS